MEMDTLDCNLSPKITPFLCNKEVEERQRFILKCISFPMPNGVNGLSNR